MKRSNLNESLPRIPIISFPFHFLFRIFFIRIFAIREFGNFRAVMKNWIKKRKHTLLNMTNSHSNIVLFTSLHATGHNSFGGKTVSLSSHTSQCSQDHACVHAIRCVRYLMFALLVSVANYLAGIRH